jgi:hypothetical protein
MVSQERQHPALIWREAYDVFGPHKGLSVYWELTEGGSGYFAGLQYATITRLDSRRWELSRFNKAVPIVTIHRTLKEAKALGLIETRFNLAQGLT